VEIYNLFNGKEGRLSEMGLYRVLPKSPQGKSVTAYIFFLCSKKGKERVIITTIKWRMKGNKRT
jgi:hypothetical protein